MVSQSLVAEESKLKHRALDDPNGLELALFSRVEPDETIGFSSLMLVKTSSHKSLSNAMSDLSSSNCSRISLSFNPNLRQLFKKIEKLDFVVLGFAWNSLGRDKLVQLWTGHPGYVSSFQFFAIGVEKDEFWTFAGDLPESGAFEVLFKFLSSVIVKIHFFTQFSAAKLCWETLFLDRY